MNLWQDCKETGKLVRSDYRIGGRGVCKRHYSERMGQEPREEKTMAVNCKCGCGEALGAKDVAAGRDYKWGHKAKKGKRDRPTDLFHRSGLLAEVASRKRSPSCASSVTA